MNCRTFKKLLPEYLYGEISPADRERFQGHLSSCPGCRRLLRGLTATVSLLREGSGPHFSSGEMAALRMKVIEEVPRLPRSLGQGLSRPWRLFSRPILLPAAGALAAAAVVAAVLIARQPAAPPRGIQSLPPAEVSELVAISETVEEEFKDVAEMCGEIDDIQAIFLAAPEPGSEAGKYVPSVSAAV